MVIDVSRTLFGYKGELVFKESQDEHYLTDNPNRRCPLICKAREDLGYEPRISIDDGLKQSLIWYKDNIDGADQ